jgi:hypothetical protein
LEEADIQDLPLPNGQSMVIDVNYDAEVEYYENFVIQMQQQMGAVNEDQKRQQFHIKSRDVNFAEALEQYWDNRWGEIIELGDAAVRWMPVSGSLIDLEEAKYEEKLGTGTKAAVYVAGAWFVFDIVTMGVEGSASKASKKTIIKSFANWGDEISDGARMAEQAFDAARSSSRILNTTTKQLQAKFKHAADFGVTGNWNKAAAGRFNSAINQHINSAGVKTINGTYRGQSVIHTVNPNTGLNVISSPSGQFISGWKLNPAQLQNVLKHGGL